MLLCENLTFRDECRAFFSSLCSAYLEAFTWDACSPRVCSLRDDYCRCVVLDGPTGILTPRGRAWSRSSSSRRYSNVDDYACSSSRHSQSSLAGGGQHLHLLYSVPYRPMGNHITLLRIIWRPASNQQRILNVSFVRDTKRPSAGIAIARSAALFSCPRVYR